MIFDNYIGKRVSITNIEGGIQIKIMFLGQAPFLLEGYSMANVKNRTVLTVNRVVYEEDGKKVNLVSPSGRIVLIIKH